MKWRPWPWAAIGLCWLRLAAGVSHKLRIVSYNIHAFRDSEHVDSFDRLVDVLRVLNADIVCLQECLHPYAADVAFSKRRDRIDYMEAVKQGRGRGREVPSPPARLSYLERLSRALEMPHFRHVEAERDLCYFGAVPFGCAILSRHDVVEWQSTVMHSTPEDAQLGNQPRDFAESRAAIWATVRCTGLADLVVATTHIDHKSEELRLKQLVACVDKISASNRPVLICGVSFCLSSSEGAHESAQDLNTFQRADHTDETWTKILDFYSSRDWPAPSERSLALDYLVEAGFHDAHALAPEAAEGTGLPSLTCWTHRPLFRIDHCFLSDVFLAKFGKVNAFNTVNTAASDHFPLVVDLEWSSSS